MVNGIAAEGGRAEFVAGDVADEGSWRRAAGLATERYGRLDALVLRWASRPWSMAWSTARVRSWQPLR